MRVELDVDLRPAGPALKPKPVVDPEVVAENRGRAREERLLRRIALAQVVETRIAAGAFADMADVARRCGVSRARMSTIMNWREN
jgi:hypothetical protein